MTDMPKVSIITPCYNNVTTIFETIESVNGQTYENIEMIIVNDGSTDQTEEKVKAYIDSNKAGNITFITHPNQGPSRSRNSGARLATGKYLLFLDADDKIAPSFVASCVAVLEKNKDINIVYTDGEFFGAKTGRWNLPAFKLTSFLGQNCIPMTSMVHREVFNKVGGFDESLHFTEDWELWIKIIKEFGPGVHQINEPLFFYRKRHDKSSLTDNKNKNEIFEKSVLYIYNKHYGLYKEHRFDIISLLTSNDLKYKRKYYNVWYRKFFYTITKKSIN